jgi:hypothetical protein
VALKRQLFARLTEQEALGQQSSWTHSSLDHAGYLPPRAGIGKTSTGGGFVRDASAKTLCGTYSLELKISTTSKHPSSLK